MAKSLEDLSVPELLDHAKRLEQNNALFGALMANPETRGDALRLVKKAKPDASIPEIDVQVEAEKLVAVERERTAKLEQEVRDLRINQRLDAERTRVMRDHDLNEAELLEVEKLMVDEKAPIPHYDAAAKVFKASRQQATPTSAALVAKTFDMPDKGMWGKGVGNKSALNKVFTEEAYRALNDVRTSGKAA